MLGFLVQGKDWKKDDNVPARDLPSHERVGAIGPKVEESTYGWQLWTGQIQDGEIILEQLRKLEYLLPRNFLAWTHFPHKVEELLLWDVSLSPRYR